MKCLVIRCARLSVRTGCIPRKAWVQNRVGVIWPPIGACNVYTWYSRPERPCSPCEWHRGQCLSHLVWKSLIKQIAPQKRPLLSARRAHLQMSTNPKPYNDSSQGWQLHPAPVRWICILNTHTCVYKEKEHLCAYREIHLFYCSNTLLNLN